MADPLPNLNKSIYQGAIGGLLARVSKEFTRPSDTTAYAANDVVSNSTSATTLIVLTGAAHIVGGGGYITGIRLATDKKSITPRIRVHFYNASTPTVAVDNVAMERLYADESLLVAHYDLAAMTTPADTSNSTLSEIYDATMRLPFVCASTDKDLYALLETLDAVTPASAEKFTLTIWVDQN